MPFSSVWPNGVKYFVSGLGCSKRNFNSSAVSTECDVILDKKKHFKIQQKRTLIHL